MSDKPMAAAIEFETYDHTFFGIPNAQGGECSIKQEFDGNGRHRIDVGGVISEPAGYCFITTVETPQGIFAGTSEYYSGSLPRVFQIIPCLND